MKKTISFVVMLGVAGLLGCGEAKKAGKAELQKAGEAKVKAAVEDRTAKPEKVGEDVREGAEGRREERREGR